MLSSIAHIRQSLRDVFRRMRTKWLNKRIPSTRQIKFDIGNTFIMPSGFGWSVIGIAATLFVLGSNLQNNTILLLCYFLIALLLLSVFHSFFYFTQHQISFSSIQADFENRIFHLPLVVQSTEEYTGGSLIFSVHSHALTYSKNKPTALAQSRIIQTLPMTGKSQNLKLALPSLVRGIHKCPQITVQARYGFGLFTCWTHITPALSIVVYPSMKKSTLITHKSSSDREFAQSSDSQYAISDNLQGIREYQATDSLHHISWKHAAKGQGLLTKDFKENVSFTAWLRFNDFNDVDQEEALQRLCYLIQQLDKDHVNFGLDLGSTQILPNQGSQHLNDCLYQLALFPRASEQGLVQ